MFEILFSSQAEKFLKKLGEKPLKEAFRKSLLQLAEDPYIGKIKRGDLSGIYGYDFKYKGTTYEIAYTISKSNDNKVVVLLAGTRENFYDQLKRYIK
jgi:mRNA interferase RelE/StbE